MVSYSLRVVFLFKILLFSLQQKTCETLEKAGGRGGQIVKRGFPTMLGGGEDCYKKRVPHKAK